MKNTVTSKQMMCASAVFIISTSLLTKPLYTFTKNDSWLAVITGFFLAFLIYLIYAALASRFPDKTIIEINNAVFGSVLGIVISVLEIIFIFVVACLDTNVMTGFSKVFVLQNTPTVLVVFMFVFICVWATRKGPVKLMSYGTVMVYVSITIVVVNVFMLYKNLDFKNLLPVLTLPWSDYIVGTHAVSMIPFGDAFILLMFLPNMHKPAEFGKSIVKGLVIGAAFLLVIVLRDILVLGGYTAYEDHPTYASIRLIDVGDIITRMDIVYMSMLIALMVYKVTIIFYAGVSAVQRLMKFKSYQTLVTISGAILVFLSLIMVSSSNEHAEFQLSGAVHFHHTFFLIILPLLTLITAALRGYFKRDHQDSSGLADKEGHQV